MKKMFLLLVATFLCASTSTAIAQTPATKPTGYLVMAYIKVTTNMGADYLKMEKAFKKLHAARKKEGKLDDWTLWKMVSPSGSAAEYNYVAENYYLNDDQYANAVEGEYMPKDWESLLTAEEVTLVKRRTDFRTIVKTEIWTITESIFSEDWTKNGKIAEFNYITSGVGKTRADHVKMEKDIWMPVHSARIKDGNMTAWWLMNLESPSGSSMPYNSVAVDLYSNMMSYLAVWFGEYFARVHPTKNADDLIKQTRENANHVKIELRMAIDRLSW